MDFLIKNKVVDAQEFTPSKRIAGVLNEDDLRSPANKNILNASGGTAYHVASRMLNTPNTFGAVNTAKLGHSEHWVLIEKGDMVVKYKDGTFDVFKPDAFKANFVAVSKKEVVTENESDES